MDAEWRQQQPSDEGSGNADNHVAYEAQATRLARIPASQPAMTPTNSKMSSPSPDMTSSLKFWENQSATLRHPCQVASFCGEMASFGNLLITAINGHRSLAVTTGSVMAATVPAAVSAAAVNASAAAPGAIKAAPAAIAADSIPGMGCIMMMMVMPVIIVIMMMMAVMAMMMAVIGAIMMAVVVMMMMMMISHRLDAGC